MFVESGGSVKLEDVKARCFISDNGCWEWRGGLSDGKWPRVHAPDHTKPGSPKTPQTGRRAVWHLLTGKPIPTGWRVYGTCPCAVCLNPEHMSCGTTAKLGKHSAKIGRFKNSPARVAANRKTGRLRSALSPETIAEIQDSSELNKVWAERLGVSPQTISRAKLGKMLAFQTAHPFAGLMT